MSSHPPSSKWPVESVLEAFSNAERGAFPVEAMAAAEALRDELIPHLQSAVDVALALSKRRTLQEEGDWRLPNFALYLLTGWQVPGTHERLRSMILLEDFYDVRWLMGELHQQWLHLVLSSLSGEEHAAFLRRKVEDESMHREVRTIFLKAVVGAAHDGRIARPPVADWLESLLDPWEDHEDSVQLSELYSQVAYMRLHHLKPRLKKGFEAGLFPKELVIFKNVERHFAEPWPGGTRVCCVANPVDDVAAMIRAWPYFKRREPCLHPLYLEMLAYEAKMHARGAHPGIWILFERNMPCDCGSGKPYGACCGLR